MQQHFGRRPRRGTSGFGVVIRVSGYAEITQCRQALPGDENIAGLDIVVNDVAAVGGTERSSQFDS